MKLGGWYFNWTNWNICFWTNVQRNPMFALVKGNKFAGVIFLRRQYVLWGPKP